MRRRSWTVALVALALVSCTAAEEAGPAAPTGKACMAHADCAAAEVCAGAVGSGHCGPALPRSYRLTIDKATDFNSFGDDGKPWDDDGTGPDPYAIVSSAKAGGAETQVCKTAVVNSSDAPEWKLNCSALLTTGSDLTFSVWDEDGDTDANMLQVTLTATELIDILRTNSGMGQAKATARLWFKIEAL